jgi:tetratricopeptide (TPR) repeat protein
MNLPTRVIIALLSITCTAIAEDFESATEKASQKLQSVMPACAKQMNAGDLAGAKATLLATFPEATRSAAESFLLGNLLFDVDRKQSYALHKAAALAEPENPQVVWEWAMEQHRAGEYEGALASYQKFSKSWPQSASPYALQADCLLQLNRVDEPIVAWQKSEKAPDGSLEQMENLVCAVNRDPVPHQRRADLLAKATLNRDVDAALELIALDCAFPFDWWNEEVHDSYLANDLPVVVKALNLPADDVRIRAINCAAECARAGDDAVAIKKSLEKHRLLIDADHTIPPYDGMVEIVLHSALLSKLLDDATLRKVIAPKLLADARKKPSSEMWNAVLYSSGENRDELLSLEREAWKSTNDPRFATGVLMIKSDLGQLAGDDPDLLAAVKQFPDNGPILREAYEVAAREKKVTKELLAQAARAEFKHFSSFVGFGTVINRPRSDYLRSYFKQLAAMRATTQQTTANESPKIERKVEN